MSRANTNPPPGPRGNPPTPPPTAPDAVTGVQLAQGIGHQPARGFWADAWSHVLGRPVAVMSIAWISLIAFFAVFAPVLASGHPWFFKDAAGSVSSPLIASLKSSDVAILAWTFIAAGIVFFARSMAVGDRLRLASAIGIQAGITVILATLVASASSGREAAPWLAGIRRDAWFVPASAAVVAALSAVPFLVLAFLIPRSSGSVAIVRAVGVVLCAGLFGLIVGWKWTPSLNTFDYRTAQSTADASAVYTAVPFSPNQSETIMFNRPPGAKPVDAWWDLIERDLLISADRIARYTDAELAEIPVPDEAAGMVLRASSAVQDLLSTDADATAAEINALVADGTIESWLDLKTYLGDLPAPVHAMGTDTLGQDVLSQMLHASRLSISIGFVSTGIAVLIGVTIGALMGYFGGWVDLLLYRVVEIFMAIPVLFVLIVAAGVLPRNIYVMMAIIGCFSWTGAARFIRAEFMKLRNTDYVQAARAAGLPLRSILFKHMLPNGVTPVLVEASFAIAAAIIVEAILSFLGLGPADQASWGKLLANAIGDAGGYMWWLAIFPGAAIFLTALSYNLIGEALRDAIDPKLKKARV